MIPAKFSGIPATFIHPDLGGYVGYCLFGFVRLEVGKQGNGYQNRSYWFDPATAPPGNVSSQTYTGDVVANSIRAFCLISPDCNITDCETCLDLTHCYECDYPFYALNNSETECIHCFILIPNCGACENASFCYTCANPYFVNGSSEC